MATPIRIKRSAVPGKRPQVTDLQVGELALNTYDAELVTLRDRFSQTGIATEVVRIGAGATVTNVIYVTKDGNDNNTGLKLGDAKASIAGAVGISTDGDVIKIAAGTYVENNPIKLPPQISIIGDSLREVTVVPQNAGSDLFHVAPGNYFSELSFTGTMNSGSSIMAFDPDTVRYSSQSPYISNCTNFVTNSIGMKIDGKHVIGPFKSMVTDSYTQYNSNGIGCSITNEGYAQIVSMFTINSDIGISAISGGQCDVTNSNSSFGNFGMVADGVGPRKYTGIITSAEDKNKDTFTLAVGIETNSVQNALYDGTSGILTVTTYTDHGYEVGVGVTLQKLAFTCESNIYPYTFISGVAGAITANTGASFTAVTGTTYAPTTGELVLDVGVAHGLSASSSLTAVNASYTPTSGVLQIITSGAHGLSNGDYIKIADSSMTFTCSRDDNATEHPYPRFSDPAFNRWLEVSGASGSTFSVNVGTSQDYAHQFVSATANGIEKAVNTIGIATEGLTFTCSKDGNVLQKPYPRTTDPAHNAVLGVEAVTADTITVNVGVATNDIFPSGKNGYIFDVTGVANSKTFTVNVGPNEYAHQYVSGGNAKLDVIRPFDGQVVFFDGLFDEVEKIKVTNGGSGYTSVPTITITAPTADFGIQATAVAIIKDGRVDEIELVSSGRGYVSTPSVTFSGGGGSSAAASVVMKPKYYAIRKSTPVSSGITTITVNDNVPYAVGVGSTVPFFKQSRILASSHSFEYIGTGVDIVNSLPSRGAVPIQDNEVDDRNGGLTIFTSTDQTGNFRIGDGVIIDQQSGTITGTFYSKSLFSTMTPFILALGGD